jgi:hypothetical protein
MGSATSQVRFDVLKRLVVFEQPIELRQLRLKAQLQRGDQGEQIDGGGPIS